MEPVLPGVQARLPPRMLRSLPKSPWPAFPGEAFEGSLSSAHPAPSRQRVNISRSSSRAGEVLERLRPRAGARGEGGRAALPAGEESPQPIGTVPALLRGQARPAERLRCCQEPAGLPAALPRPGYMGSRGGGAELFPLRQQHPGLRDSRRSGQRVTGAAATLATARWAGSWTSPSSPMKKPSMFGKSFSGTLICGKKRRNGWSEYPLSGPGDGGERVRTSGPPPPWAAGIKQPAEGVGEHTGL